MKPVILVVLDGFGIAPPSPGNAIFNAHPNFINSLIYSYPNTQLKASGEAVGLPSGEVGNTEVGHINIGAGKIVYQSLPRINLSIADSSFDKNPVFTGAIEHLKNTNGKLHLMGLISSGAVHSSVEHLYALLHFCKKNDIKEVFIHAFTDGRDSPPKMAVNYLQSVQEKIDELQIGCIVSISGRYYAMDRDKRWERTEKAYVCLTEAIGRRANSWTDAINESYKEGKTDEFIEPTNIPHNDKIITVSEGDAVIFFNYRIDRPRQLTKAFVLDDFANDANKSGYDPFAYKYSSINQGVAPQSVQPPFTRKAKIQKLYFATMTEYEVGLPTQVAFGPQQVKVPLGMIISQNNMKQLRMAESEKERFVTYYLNGLREPPYPGEDRIIIPSPRILTYDLKPEMSAVELTDTLLSKLPAKKYQFIIINYANADMVGHTGNYEAGMRAITTLDRCMQRLVNAALASNYVVLITADHGNAEVMIDPMTGEIDTEHNASPVPFIYVDSEYMNRSMKLQKGILADIAPTILELLKIEKPFQMTGRNLLEELII